jgi:micrococcal nuclease
MMGGGNCTTRPISMDDGATPPPSPLGAAEGGGTDWHEAAGLASSSLRGAWRGVVLLVGAVLLGSAACGDARDAPPAASVTRTASARETASVARVIDGDTILVRIDGREERVRYIGVDTPETVAQDRPVECFGPEASARNKALVEGRTVQMERDVSDRDRFGRLLRYVYADGVLVNAELLRDGYATSVTFPPDVRENERFRALEREAREAGRGLWSECR